MTTPSTLDDRLTDLGRRLREEPTLAPQILTALQNKSKSVESTALLVSRRRIAGLLALAASILLMVVTVAAMTSTSRAFAQVKQVVRSMRSVVIEMESKSQPEYNQRVYLLGSGQSRQEFSKQLTFIHDPATKKTIGLDNDAKTAWFQSVEQATDGWSPIRMILEKQQSAVKALGNRRKNGKDETGFLISEEGSSVRVEVWIDPSSNLPIEMIESPASTKDPFVAHRNNVWRFTFNQDLDEKLFSMSVPDGYQAVTTGPYAPSANQLAASEAVHVVLRPRIGIGDIKWGASLTEITERYGTPSELWFVDEAKNEMYREKPKGVASDRFFVRYASANLTFDFKENSGLYSITAEEASALPGRGVTFPGKTSEGIAIGSSLEDVLKAYGKPSRYRGGTESPFAVIFQEQGIAFGITNKRVSSITVTKP